MCYNTRSVTVKYTILSSSIKTALFPLASITHAIEILLFAIYKVAKYKIPQCMSLPFRYMNGL